MGGGRLRDLRDELARMGHPVALAIRHRREGGPVPDERNGPAGQGREVGGPVPGANRARVGVKAHVCDVMQRLNGPVSASACQIMDR